VAEENSAAKPRKKSALAVRSLTDIDFSQWEAFVRASPGGSAYALPQYLSALGEAVETPFRIVAALRGDEIVGGAAVLERSRRAGVSVAPRLLHHYNGFVLADYATRYPSERTSKRFEVVAALADELQARGYGRLELRHLPDVTDVRALQTRGWSVRPTYSYVVPLTDLEQQWQRVDQNLRRLVERARREGVTFDPDLDPLELWRLHLETHVRKGTPLYLPEDIFLRFVSRLVAEGLAGVYGARMPDGRVAAAQLVLLGHCETHTVVAAADGELQSTGANPFLRWSAFEHLGATGATSTDLTDATPGPVERFKSQLGGRLEVGYLTQRLSPLFRAQLGAYHEARRLRLRLQRRR
jgi:hypothetical protein